MSNIILCERPISEMPFYLESISKHIYSVEELYYFIYSNPYLAAWDLMKEEFCDWLLQNQLQKESIDELQRMIREKESQATFLTFLIQDANYYTKEEKNKLKETFAELENKTMLECLKMKADNLMEHQKLICAMQEYKKILSSEEIKIMPMDIVGNIWNNLGTAYAKMFFYEEAMWCFRKAYAYNNHPKSLKAMECAREQASAMSKKINEINEFYKHQKEEDRNDFFEIDRKSNENTYAKYDTVILKWKKEYMNMSDLKDWSCELENGYI